MNEINYAQPFADDCISEMSGPILKNKEIVEKFMNERIFNYKKFNNSDSFEGLSIIDMFTIKINCDKITREKLEKINIFSRVILKNSISLDIINKLNENTFVIKFENNNLFFYSENNKNMISKKFYENEENVEPYVENILKDLDDFDSENVIYPKYLSLLTLNNLYNFNIKNLPDSLLGLRINNKKYNKTINLPPNLESFVCNSENEYNILTSNEEKFPNNLENLFYGGKYMKYPDSLKNLYYFGKDDITINNKNLENLEIIIKQENNKIKLPITNNYEFVNINDNINYYDINDDINDDIIDILNKRKRIINIENIKKSDSSQIIIINTNEKNNEIFMFPEKVSILKHNITKFKPQKLKIVEELWMNEQNLSKSIIEYNVKKLHLFNKSNSIFSNDRVAETKDNKKGYLYLPSSIRELSIKKYVMTDIMTKNTKNFFYEDIKIHNDLMNNNFVEPDKKEPIVISYLKNLPNKIYNLHINEDNNKVNIYKKIKIPYNIRCITVNNTLCKISKIPPNILNKINKIYFRNIGNIEDEILSDKSYEDIFKYIEMTFERYETERGVFISKMSEEKDEEIIKHYREQISKLDKLLDPKNDSLFNFCSDNRVIRNNKFEKINIKEKEESESKKINDLLQKISCNKYFMDKIKFVKKCYDQRVSIDNLKY